MESLLEKIEAYKKEIADCAAADPKAVEEFRIKWLGTKGIVKEIMGEMKSVPADQKKEAGQLLNEFKQFAEAKLEELKENAVNGQASSSATIDLTLPGDPTPLGSRHPVTLMRNRIVSIFQRLGFAVAEGPEIEDDWHNFGALNLPPHHPARDMQDTFYVQQNPDWVLRTHTSSVQIREMEKGKLPIRMLMPGRVFRNETVSARSHCFFHQVEGLYIDENVSFADLETDPLFFCKRNVWQGCKGPVQAILFPIHRTKRGNGCHLLSFAEVVAVIFVRKQVG